MGIQGWGQESHAGAAGTVAPRGVEGWGPRQSQQGGNPQASSSLAPRLYILGLLPPGLTLSPGWGQPAPAALFPGRMGPGLGRQMPPPPQTRTVFPSRPSARQSHREERRFLRARGRLRQRQRETTRV